MGNSVFVGLKCQCCVEARDVLREQLSADLSRFFSAKASGIPGRFDEDIGIVSSCDINVPCSCIADDGSVVKYVQVEVRNICCVFGRVGEVDEGLEVERVLPSAKDSEITDFRLEIRKAATCRDRYNLVSFGAVELKKSKRYANVSRERHPLQANL